MPFSTYLPQHMGSIRLTPPGPFVAGQLRPDPLSSGSEPLSEKRYTKGYLIDTFEYPNVRGAMPMFEISYQKAKELCRDGGKRVCTADEWERRHAEWLPSPNDREYLLSIMAQPVYERGRFANYIAPPRRGINQQPVDFEYVRTEL